MHQREVQQGDCMVNIAEEAGFPWEVLWNHSANASLKALRLDPNVLFPGDVVNIPDKTERVETAPTEQTARFVKKSACAQVRLRLLDHQRRPRRNVQFEALIENTVHNGQTDANGFITILVLPNARQLTLRLTEESRVEEYVLPLGTIDPVDEVSGVQHRLTNLGFLCNEELGTVGAQTQAALRSFQREMNLEINGAPDAITRAKLKELHGS